MASAEPSPCNNILDFTERFDDRGTTRLCALMLKWGDGVRVLLFFVTILILLHVSCCVLAVSLSPSLDDIDFAGA